MEKFDVLEKEIDQLINQNKKFKSEIEKNLKELEHLRAENIRAGKLIQENETLHKQKFTVKTKLNELLDKFSKAGV
ncbi:MAG: hypothetical protein AUJ85_09760 [Elusimicrobia bacterium CG1_02_37_114]|nr:MAG: hypothetical protein AUJ85_09760 [Elusimicrobia bacterium CG1_02_37_114]PIV54052.1 MAG: hypothetical protein COS17_00485 [Elusimicrobia bacterium CG02_land_8_20_14_3_00_37_13]PIZ12698.1 MAG: hypothetical protein COY53_08695 [Elusimicrobia bacterium CG_4_10_14_0_8_um_filter_37_32]